MAKLKTHNVVEYSNEMILGIHSFTEEEEAKEMFAEVAKENGFEADAIADGLESGELSFSSYQVFLVTSED